MHKITANIFGIKRHRLNIDGDGIVTLVAFYGCPINCRYCLNNECHDYPPKANKNITPEQLLSHVSIDNLYFIATGGGITFGGGEPLLNYQFIKKFKEIANPLWKINIETSLNIPLNNLKELLPIVDSWIIDIKDLNHEIYQSYTGNDIVNVEQNLQYLSEQSYQDRCLIRLPIIPNYNNEQNILKSKEKLGLLGYSKFDEFSYVIKKPID